MRNLVVTTIVASLAGLAGCAATADGPATAATDRPACRSERVHPENQALVDYLWCQCASAEDWDRDKQPRYVVFVIDSTGSMLPAFVRALQVVRESLAAMTERQEFHVVFFARDGFTESPARGLIAADQRGKSQAEAFLKDARAMGYGSSPIPALSAAFRALQHRPDEPGKGKLMVILTDGDFDTTTVKHRGLSGAEGVAVWLRDYNAAKTVHVCPIVVSDAPDRETTDSMRKLAADNAGVYRVIKP